MSTCVFEDCEVLVETEKAILVTIPDLGEDVWIPKSVIHDDSEVYAAEHKGELAVKEWWAEKEGLT